MNTNLIAVATELGVTKTAIYRHFRGKQELLQALEGTYAAAFTERIIAPLAKTAATTPIETVLNGYLQTIFSLYRETPTYYDYHMWRFVKRYAGGPTDRVVDTAAHHIDHLTELLSRHFPTEWDAHLRTLAVRYITIAGAFFAINRPLAGETPPIKVEALTHHILHGFLPSAMEVDIPLVNRIAWINSQEIPPHDRVIDAIISTVMSHGYQNATIEAIAHQAGLSKSGLYHYFQSKDAMFAKTHISIQRFFGEITRMRFGQLATVHERLYALLVILSSYAINDHAGMIIYTWVRESNIEVVLPYDHLEKMRELFLFIHDILQESGYSSQQARNYQLLDFFTKVVHHEVMKIQTKGSPDRQAVETLCENIFTLLTRGISPSLPLSTESTP